MPFYTFIMDYKGGTYISQVNAPSVNKACEKWAKNLKVSEIEDFGIKSKETLINEIKADVPVAIKETSNVWCISPCIRGSSALVNIVQTESINNANPKSEI